MEDNWGIIGHQNIISFLANCLYCHKLAQTYFFYGPAGVGKSTVAKKFAEKIIGSGNLNAELFILQAEEDKRDIAIEQVRDWRRSLALKSFGNNYKVGLILEAEQLNKASANALLKTLEEPVPNTVIIIVASDWSKLPGTIFSRSQAIKFLPVKSTAIKNYLLRQNLSAPAIDQIITLSAGLPGEAITIALNQQKLVERQQQVQAVQHLLAETVPSRFQYVSNLIDAEEDSIAKAKVAINFLNTLEVLLNQSLIKFINQGPAIGQGYNLKKYWEIFGLTQNARVDLKGNLNPKLILENILLNL